MAFDKWTREQTIVALRTYFIVPFNKATSNNPEIIEKAKIIGRGVNSLKMKIGNFGSLDPELAKRGIVGLTGGSKLDKEIWDEFSNDREKLAYESDILLSKFTHKPFEELVEIKPGDFPNGIDKYTIVKARVNQRFFRESILGIYDSKCCITGMGIKELLQASHIVPWAENIADRLNPENGLCLNPLHHNAFDEGLITITQDYKVKLSRKISELQNQDVIKKFFIDYDGATIMMPERYYPRIEFLEYHQNVRFKI